MEKCKKKNGNVQGMTTVAIECASGVHFETEVEQPQWTVQAVSQKVHPRSTPNALWGQQASHAQDEVTASADALA